jgi:hypothetical protein
MRSQNEFRSGRILQGLKKKQGMLVVSRGTGLQEFDVAKYFFSLRSIPKDDVACINNWLINLATPPTLL